MQIIVSFNKPEHAQEIYKERWQIETVFKALKSSCFNIEETHLRDINRIERLLAVVLLAFTWAYITGIYVNDNVYASTDIRLNRSLKRGWILS